MKFGKEEYQKMFLGGLLLITLVYGYFEMLLGPLKLSKIGLEREIATLTQQIRDSKTVVRKTQDLEASVKDTERVVNQVRAMIPEGAPVAWFPALVAEHFKRQGLDKAATRLTSEQPDRDLPGYRRMNWSVDLSKVEFVQLGEALAEFENQEPLVEIIGLQVEPYGNDFTFQRASLSLRNTVTQ